MASSHEGPFLLSAWQRLVNSPVTPRVLVAVGCYFLILAITANHFAHPKSPRLQVGDVARADYIAPRSAVYTDTQATIEAQEQAASAVQPIYTPNPAVTSKITQDLAGFFLRLDELATQLRMLERVETSQEEITVDEGDESAESVPATGSVDIESVEDNAVAELMALLDQSLQIQRYLIDPVSTEDVRTLLRMDADTRELFKDLVDRSIRERIIDVIFESQLAQEIDDLRETVLAKAAEVGLNPEYARLAGQIAGYFMRPNATLDNAATAIAQQEARSATLPVQQEVRAGEIFLRAGEVVTQEHIDILTALGITGETERRSVWQAIVLFAIVLAAAFALGSAFLTRKNVPMMADSRYYLLFYTIVTIAYLSSFYLMQILSAGTSDNVTLSLAALPVISAAVLFAHYFTRILALTASGFLAVIVTVAAGEPSLLLPALFPAIAASLMVKRDCPKPLMIRAIVLLPLLWLAGLLALAFTANLDLSRLQENPWYLIAGVAPAPAALILANYVLDAAFNAPTTSRLQEFDNQDHPLLRKLQLEAPGTWHHSMMTGLIAEAACQALGGNAHLVRIACMYHDIGKTRRPEFFIENQRGGENVHDKYSPWLSKIIVESHVKDGIAMAQAHGLPKELIDMIPQHHGTCLITYFFRKALAMSEEGYVNEFDYRYPGPKPQTLEAACINMADAAESAIRSLDDPTPHRIEQLVNRIYEERLLDGQYNECGLALNQLETIKKTIIDRLVGAYHARIEYPEEEELRRQLQLKRAVAEKTQKQEASANEEE